MVVDNLLTESLACVDSGTARQPANLNVAIPGHEAVEDSISQYASQYSPPPS